MIIKGVLNLEFSRHILTVSSALPSVEFGFGEISGFCKNQAGPFNILRRPFSTLPHKEIGRRCFGIVLTPERRNERLRVYNSALVL